jgi:hypothetical protein
MREPAYEPSPQVTQVKPVVHSPVEAKANTPVNDQG